MQNRDIFFIFFIMLVCCVFLLESPHQGNSNEYTQYTVFNIKEKIILNYPKSAAMGLFQGTRKRVFEAAVVDEPSVFEPLKFYYICEQQLHYYKTTSNMPMEFRIKGRRPSVPRPVKCQYVVNMSITCMLKNAIRGDGKFPPLPLSKPLP